MRAGEVMQTELHFVSPRASVQEAAQLMAELGVRVLPVGSPEDLLGIVTDGDLLIRVVARGRDSRGIEISEIMSRSVVVCAVDDPLESAAAEMASRDIRRMPVIDAAKRVVGLLDRDDLPGSRKHQAPHAPNRDRADQAAPASLLIVEDEEDIRELLAAMLADAGHQCAEAGTCAAARALIEAQVFDLVITDVKLPDASGIDVAQAAKKAGMPCLLITGDANQMQRLELRDVEYLAKPFRATELRERVRRLLPAKRATRQDAAAAERTEPAATHRRARWFPFRIK